MLSLQKVYKRLYEKVIHIPNKFDYELSAAILNSGEYAVARCRRGTGEYFEREHHLRQMYGKFKPITPELFTNYYYFLLRENSMHTYELQKLVNTAEETGLRRFWQEDVSFQCLLPQNLFYVCFFGRD